MKKSVGCVANSYHAQRFMDFPTDLEALSGED